MTYQTFKEYSKWLGLISAVISGATLGYVKYEWVFVNGNEAGRLVLISMITALFTLLFGVISLPRWQGVVALIVFSFVGYYILFTPLYAVA